jgi:hypothetical protein
MRYVLMNLPNRRHVSVVVVAVAIAVWSGRSSPAAVAPDEVLNWNTVATSVAPAAGKNGQQQSRIYAMTQLAVHDALNAIAHHYEPYAFTQTEDATASPSAAVATAAHDVLAHELPTQLAAIDTAWATSLAAIPPGPGLINGVSIGHAAAAAMLNARSTDGSSTFTPYTPGTGPGQWRPTPNPTPPSPASGASYLPASLPGWGNVTPFFLNNGEQFRPDGPPSLASTQYAQDYFEVKMIGEQFGPRTLDESAIARFWYEPSPLGWNRIARNIAGSYALDLWQEARLLALVHGAMADGFIAGFNAKYYFNFWRPVTAIREGDTDGNDQTMADPFWNTFLNTPSIPDYPSTHSVLGGAAARVLAMFFGADEITFTTTSGAPFAGITRTYTSLSQAAHENADSRVLAGIHFRTACTDGLKQGDQIGKFVAKHFLHPVDPQ